jgi:cation transport ATPase
MYNRDGSPRGSWFDPLGFAGLDKVPPPPQALGYLQKNCDEVTARQNELSNLIPKKAGDLQVLGIKLKGMEGNPHLAKQYAALEKKSNALAEEVKNLRKEYSENEALLQGLTQRLERMKADVKDEPRAHVHHLAVPVRAMRVRYGRAAETWAAISLSLMLFAIAALIFFAPAFIWAGLVIIMILFVLAESILRGAFIETMTRITLFLALVSALILFIHFWDAILVIGLVALGVFLMLQRLRELTG